MEGPVRAEMDGHRLDLLSVRSGGKDDRGPSGFGPGRGRRRQKTEEECGDEGGTRGDHGVVRRFGASDGGRSLSAVKPPRAKPAWTAL